MPEQMLKKRGIAHISVALLVLVSVFFAGASAAGDNLGGRAAASTEPYVGEIDPHTCWPGGVVTLRGIHFGEAREENGQDGRTAESYVVFGDIPAEDYVSWSDTEIKVKVPEGASSGAVNVRTGHGQTWGSPALIIDYPDWYLAEGSVVSPFDTYITIENPNDSGVNARVTFMPPEGETALRNIYLAAGSQTTLFGDFIADALGGAKDFSTKVECLERKTIAVDRTMSWSVHGLPGGEAHSSIGVTAPSRAWHLPEGSSDWGFECWLTVQNPNDSPARCRFEYMIEAGVSRTVSHVVPPRSRASFNMEDDIGENDASIRISSDVPVVPERSMYRNDKREGHCSIGATRPSLKYYLAEGTTAWGFTTYVLVQNPTAASAEVTVTFMTPSGPAPQKPFTMPALSRKTIRVNDVLPCADFSTEVSATEPIIAERAMYWTDESGLEACHDSIGVRRSRPVFYFPDGWTGGDVVRGTDHETWIVVQNPASSTAEVKVSYLREGGQGNITFTDYIPAYSRRSYSMADRLTDARAAVVVMTREDNPRCQVVAERSMYWENRGAGTNTIGCFDDCLFGGWVIPGPPDDY